MMRSGVSVPMEDAEVDRYKGRADSLEGDFYLSHTSNKLHPINRVGDAFFGSVPQRLLLLISEETAHLKQVFSITN